MSSVEGVIGLSQTINAQSMSGGIFGGIDGKKSSAKTPTPNKAESFLEPQTAPPSKKYTKQQQKEAIAAANPPNENKERARKMIEYKKSEHFQERLKDFHIPKGFSEDSDNTQINNLWRDFSSLMYSDAKRHIVDSLFEQIFTWTEYGLVEMMEKEDYRYMSDVAMARKRDFQPELEELAIELDPKWVPSPMCRIGMKMAQFVMGYAAQVKKMKQTEKKHKKEKDPEEEQEQ